MKKIIYLCLFLSISLLGYGQGSITGGSTPLCPNIQYNYTYNFPNPEPLDPTQYPYDGDAVTIYVYGGVLVGGGACSTCTGGTFYPAYGATSLTFGVKWNDQNPLGNGITILSYSFPTLTQNNFNVHSIKNVQTSVNISSPLTFSGSVINIPQGTSGSCVLTASAWYYDVLNNYNTVSQFKWIVNGQTQSTTGNKYTLSYTSANNNLNGTTISVEAVNNGCGGSSDGPKSTMTVSRTIPENWNITNTQISSSQNFEAYNTINVTNSSISNNATVNMKAGAQIAINQPFSAPSGTILALTIDPSIFRSASTGDTIYTPPPIEDNSQDRSANINVQNITDDNSPRLNRMGQNTPKVNWIGQNTPNPFNDETVIDYYLLEQSTTASIQVNDLTGRIVKSFPLLEKGQGKLTIQKSELSKGVYTYSLIVDNKLIATKKMVIK